MNELTVFVKEMNIILFNVPGVLACIHLCHLQIEIWTCKHVIFVVFGKLGDGQITETKQS